MEVKFKKLFPHVHIPSRATSGAAGFDLTCHNITSCDGNTIRYGTGIAVEIPEGYFGLLCARSSIYKHGLFMPDGVGIIDNDFRGELAFIFAPYSCRFSGGGDYPSSVSYDYECYRYGDRIGQLVIMPLPEVRFVEVERLSETERGTGGFGSTGK